jgi:short-chain Z-isoprenyl diphosphate synthase
MGRARRTARGAVYALYTRRLQRRLDPDQMPRHVGVIVDGNRRWARTSDGAGGNGAAADGSGQRAGYRAGYRAGADKITEFLGWCEEAGVEVVTLWLLSTDNLNRDTEELADLLAVIEDLVASLAGTGRWRLQSLGALDLLPAHTAEALKESAAATANVDGLTVNVAVGYGGRRELADAVRALLHEHASRGTTIEELAEILDVEHIAGHLYTKGQPDPDLVIRTSGEQRLSGFLLWQSAHSEFWFCDALWPDFRHVDFLRALRAYAARERRYGV